MQNVATAILGAGALGALATFAGGQSAADTQSSAAREAAGLSATQFAQMRADLAPFITAGQSAVGTQNALMPAFITPIGLTAESVARTPGYQFALQQGLKSVNNAASGKYGTLSGPQIKAAQRFATGLADQTYQNQFNNALTNQNNAFTRLLQMSQLGANAAAGVGQAGLSSAATQGNALIGGANAQAAADVSAANALSGFGNNAGQLALLNAIIRAQQAPAGTVTGLFG